MIIIFTSYAVHVYKTFTIGCTIVSAQRILCSSVTLWQYPTWSHACVQINFSIRIYNISEMLYDIMGWVWEGGVLKVSY